MSALLIPDFMFDAFSDVDPEFLKKQKITTLLCDIDNTLSPYEDAVPSEAVRGWVRELQAAGISLALISNNTPKRVETYNAPLGLVAYADAKKPSKQRYLDAMAKLGVDRKSCAVLGDQLLTDAWSAKRLGIDILSVAAHDARTPLENLVGTCDFVICDVPCTGLGVMAKKPEIRFHAPELYKELAPLGGEILRASAKYLKTGGRLLYSTCTLTKAENEDNFYGFLAENPSFAPLDFAVGAVKSENGCVTLLPDGKRDGFFIGLTQKVR